jgi:hypothetical protein
LQSNQFCAFHQTFIVPNGTFVANDCVVGACSAVTSGSSVSNRNAMCLQHVLTIVPVLFLFTLFVRCTNGDAPLQFDSSDSNAIRHELKVRTCEPIHLSLCQQIGYNSTGYPNLAGHEEQRDADIELHTFKALLHSGCSPHINLLFCSVFTPLCSEKVSNRSLSCSQPLSLILIVLCSGTQSNRTVSVSVHVGSLSM